MEGERRVARRKGGEEKWEWMVALNPKGGGRIALTLFDTESTRVYEKMSLYMGGGVARDQMNGLVVSQSLRESI